MLDAIRYPLKKIQSYFCDCDISLFHKFFKPPYGGSNQFFLALKKELIRRNYSVGANCIGNNTKAVLINSFAFDKRLLSGLRRERCRIIHRVVGPVALYRGTTESEADMMQLEANKEFADLTVFQSRYSLDAHLAMGVKFKNPVVIMNGVDPCIFYPPPATSITRNGKIKLIATSWSNHPNKGLQTYQWLDSNLDWNRFHFTFAGRVDSAEFRNIQVIPPVPSEQLADIIRQHDIYLTASLHDTCSNGLLEGMACGLPAIYANSGGNPEIVKKAGFGFDTAEEIPARLEQLIDEYDYRKKEIAIPPLSSIADKYLAAAGLS